MSMTEVFDRLLRGWLETLSAEQTRKTYRSRVTQFWRWCIAEGVDPIRATPSDLRRYHTTQIRPDGDSKGLEDTTIFVTGTAVRSLFDYLVRTGVRTENPMDDPYVQWPTSSERKTVAPRVLSVSEASDLWQAAHSLSDRHAIAVGLFLVNGMLPAEVEAANLADLELPPSGTATLLIRNRGDWHRTPLAGATAAAISRHASGREDGPLLLNTIDNRVNDANLRRYVSQVAEAAHVKRITPRQLSKAGAILALRHGALPGDVMASVGIRSARDMRRYFEAARSESGDHPAVRIASLLSGTAYPRLDQADRLLRDEGMEPATAVMLAGAVLEERLRRLCDERGVTPPWPEKDWTIHKLKGVLNSRASSRLNPQQNVDIDRIALVRNDAAHGWFELIDHDRARALLRDVRAFLEATDSG